MNSGRKGYKKKVRIKKKRNTRIGIKEKKNKKQINRGNLRRRENGDIQAVPLGKPYIDSFLRSATPEASYF